MDDNRAQRLGLAVLGAVIVYAVLLMAHPLPDVFNTAVQFAIFGTAAVVLWRHGALYRLPAAGFVLLSAALVALAWLRATGQNDFMAMDDPPRLLGMALLGYFCARRQPHQKPGVLWLLGAVYVVCFAVQGLLSLRYDAFPWDLTLHALLVSFIVVASLPSVAAVMAGRATSGRLLWFLGWQLWWLAHVAIMPMESGVIPNTITLLANLFNLGSFFLAIGILAEARRWEMGLWPYLLGVGALLTGWLAGLIQLASAPDFVFLNLLIGGGVMLFANAYILLASYLRAIAHAQAGLQEQESRLRQATAAKTEFLASLSHELRTPLNAIIGFSEALADGILGTLNTVQKEFMKDICQAGERLLHLINRVLDYSKFEAGKMPIAYQEIELSAWLEALASPYQMRAQEKGLAFVLDCDPSLARWRLDPNLTQMTIEGLLDNAIKFTDTGTVSLNAALSASGQLEIKVEDSGPGIGDAQHSRLFQPLEQFGGDREQGKQGAGLGLALAKEAIVCQGGELHLAPSMQGACFVITLPPEAGPQPMAASASDRQESNTLVPPTRAFPWIAGTALATLAFVTLFFSSHGNASVLRFISAAWCAAAAVLAWKAAPSLLFRLVGCGMALASLVYGLMALALQERWMLIYQWSQWCWVFTDNLCFFALAMQKPRSQPLLAWIGYALFVLASLHVSTLALPGQYDLSIFIYLWIGLMGMGLALPAIEYSLKGLAAPGRLIWTGGLALYWLGAYGDALALALPKSEIFFTAGFYPLYAYGLLLIGSGLFIEARRWEMGLWPLLFLVGSALLIWGMVAYLLRPFAHALPYWVITGGCTIYLLALGILVAHHNRAKRLLQALQETRDTAQQTSADKTRFLTTMSHELRTPLNVVLGFSDFLRRGEAGPVEPEAQDALGEIENAGEHLLSLVVDIMDLSRVEEGKPTLEVAPVDVDALLKNSLAIVKERAHRKHIKLGLEVEDDIGTCDLDARKVKQVVFNLLSNAVKFTPEGGAVSLLAQRMPKVDVLACSTQAGFNAMALADALWFLAITVKDSGIGIALEDLPRLFRKYSQLEAGRVQQGTGLGLHLVKEFAELHGGSVMVQSTLGAGSTFCVFLPWGDGTQAAGALSSAA